jgi:hypothetical protein
MVEGVNLSHALVAKCQLKHLKQHILVLEYNKAKTFKRIGSCLELLVKHESSELEINKKEIVKVMEVLL